jgi:CcmD family protein
MADAFRAEGKIYVVVAVILLIFAGLLIYMVRIDRKLKRLEKELDMEK